MKVYLLNPPFYPRFGRAMRWQDTGRAGTLYYPVWLAYATAALQQGHEVKLADAPAWGWGREEVISDVQNFKPGLTVIDSSFPSLNNDIAVAEAIKEKQPDTRVVMVGPPTSQYADRILRSPGIDAVARWEYDFTLRELASGKGTDLATIKGLSYRTDGNIVHNPDRLWSDSNELDTIPHVSQIYKKFLNPRDYFLVNSLYPEVQIFTGRGCPFHCTFCSWPQTLMGRKYRVRSTSSVIDEVEWVQRNMPEIREVFFEDDTFTIDRARVLAFTEAYRKKGLTIAWACNARASLDYDILKKMKDANCRLLIVGYESGNDAILKNIKKGTTVEQIREFARNARKAGLLVNGDFIIGLPGETKETIGATLALIREIRPDILQVSVASPFPGTEFYDWSRNSGYLLTEDPGEYLDEQGHQKAIISYPHLTAREMVQVVDRTLRGYYLAPSYIPLVLRQVCRRNGQHELARVWRSARVFLKYIFNRKN